MITYFCSRTDIDYKMHFDITFYMLLVFIQVLVHAVIWPNNLITGFLFYDDGCMPFKEVWQQYSVCQPNPNWNTFGLAKHSD